jgi:hypothetical protein
MTCVDEEYLFLGVCDCIEFADDNGGVFFYLS